MIQLLGMAWSLWKLATKRFGAAGGAIATAAALAAYVIVKERLRKRNPAAAETLDHIA